MKQFLLMIALCTICGFNTHAGEESNRMYSVNLRTTETDMVCIGIPVTAYFDTVDSESGKRYSEWATKKVNFHVQKNILRGNFQNLASKKIGKNLLLFEKITLDGTSIKIGNVTIDNRIPGKIANVNLGEHLLKNITLNNDPYEANNIEQFFVLIENQ